MIIKINLNFENELKSFFSDFSLVQIFRCFQHFGPLLSLYCDDQ